MRWRKKSLFVISLSFLIAALVWSQIGMYVVHLLFGINIQINIFNLCISLFKQNSIYYFLVIVLLNVLIAYTVLITIWRLVEQYILSKRFRVKLLQLQHTKLTNALNQEFNRPRQDIIVIHHDQLLAFTIGFIKPSIVLSSGLLEMLEDNELEAVIEHETFHQKNYDGFKIFTLQLIAQALSFIPLTKWSYQNYKIISELLADEYAIQQTGSELGLGSALLKLIKNSFHEASSPTLIHFANESVNYRLQQLVDPQKHIPVKLETAAVVISIHVILLFMSMIVVTAT